MTVTVQVLLETLEPAIDRNTVGLAQRCIDALTEFVQGNTSSLPGKALLDTKLLEVI